MLGFCNFILIISSFLSNDHFSFNFFCYLTGDSGGPLWTEKDLKTHNGTLQNVAVLIGVVRNYY